MTQKKKTKAELGDEKIQVIRPDGQEVTVYRHQYDEQLKAKGFKEKK